MYIKQSSRNILSVIVFLTGFCFSLVIVVFSTKNNIEKKANFYLSTILKPLIINIDKEESSLPLLEEALFGHVFQIEIYGDFQHIIKVMSDLDFGSSLNLYTLQYKNNPLGSLYPNFYRIDNPEIINVLTSKIQKKTLNSPTFMQKNQIFYKRKHPKDLDKIMDFKKSFFLYQKIKILPTHIEPAYKENIDEQFYIDLIETHLYSDEQNAIIKKFYYPNGGFVSKQQFLFYYLPMIQGAFIFNFYHFTFYDLFKLDPVGILLSIIIALIMVLILRFYIKVDNTFIYIPRKK